MRSTNNETPVERNRAYGVVVMVLDFLQGGFFPPSFFNPMNHQ